MVNTSRIRISRGGGGHIAHNTVKEIIMLKREPEEPDWRWILSL
jgi:hypothetical protein